MDGSKQNGFTNGMEVDGFTEASMMLSSALEQLDNIISGSGYNSKPVVNSWEMCNGSLSNGSSLSDDSRSPPSDIPPAPPDVSALTRQLVDAVNSTTIPRRPSDFSTIRTLVEWLVPAGDKLQSPSPSMSTVSCPEYGDLQDKLHRLETDRQSLSLQVTVLSEQVGAQTEKIKDLETLLDDKRHKLDSTEEMLQEELEARTGLETHKLDLMSEVSGLKLKFASLERDKVETDNKLRYAQSEIDHLHKLVLQNKGGGDVGRNSSPNPGPVTVDPGELTSLMHKLRLRTGEIDQLRVAVQQLMADNSQKEQHIDQLKATLEQHLRLENHIANATMPRSVSGYGTVSDDSSTLNNTGDFDLNQQLRKLLSDDDSDFISPSTTLQDSMSFSSAGRSTLPQSRSVPGLAGVVTSSPSYTSSLSAMSASSFGQTWSSSGTPRHGPKANARAPQPSSPAARQLAAELNEIKLGGPCYSTGSLPRNLGSGQKAFSTLTLPSRKISGEWRPPRPPLKMRGGLKWLRKTLRPSKRSTSAPNLADSDDETVRSSKPSAGNTNFKRDRKYRSFRDLIGKIKRSSSQELRHRKMSDDGGFNRGVLARSTAGARVGQNWTSPPSQHLPLRPPMSLFVQWDNGQICDWMNEVGLNQYVPQAKHVVQSGRHLLIMNQTEMERDLGMKNPLHRKKLRLALLAIEKGKSEPQDRMDFHQVLRWLDDIGLPQFRDIFAEALVDGQMLVALTVDDLLSMKIVNAIQHATLARGVQVLRAINFNLNRLQRKFNPDSIAKGSATAVVELWSQHCVSEWLRTIDLTEFTPNLMCAGIHGALMVLEPTFTAESLAEVLQIPITKTLLRRHLTTHFNELIGQDIVARKREVLAQSYVLQLVPTLKVKPLKKGFSLSRKRSKSEVYAEPDEYICPPSGHSPAPVIYTKSTESEVPLTAPLSVLENMAASNV